MTGNACALVSHCGTSGTIPSILKERLFGVTNSDGNRGEDVKEYYFYIESTPTHSYVKYLYKYPQREFPYYLIESSRPACSGASSFTTSTWNGGCLIIRV